MKKGIDGLGRVLGINKHSNRRLVEYATATADPFVPGYEGELNRWLQPPPGEGCGCTVQ